MSLSLLQGYSSPEEEEDEQTNLTSDDEDNDRLNDHVSGDRTTSNNFKKPLFDPPNPSASSSLPSIHLRTKQHHTPPAPLAELQTRGLMSIRFVGRRASSFVSNTVVRHNVRDLISQNYCLDVNNINPNFNLITRSFRRFPLSNQMSQNPVYGLYSIHSLRSHVRLATNSAVEMRMDKDVVRFCIGKQRERPNSLTEREKKQRRIKVSRKAKLNELRFYRLKAKKKMRSPNPEIRMLYRLGKVRINYRLLFACLTIYSFAGRRYIFGSLVRSSKLTSISSDTLNTASS